jgi:hypothetical protein
MRPRQISGDHPEWGEDKIAEELEIKLGVKHSTSTIRNYMASRRKPSTTAEKIGVIGVYL